ncbi:hypothetical protein GCM10010965_27840 [Caldalkalibacillus thermarum]|uniref:glycosyltransferase n=1 Tax=Caldalkalibacillus thermarum TaxID=296745 RepID=UPI001665B29C|nr:glycosyltransferase family A protein [Caldalkalibacillus thermarum]GGK33385.1 hypothetical protein GCM10010965_27840 [Caldalkalibacillus thermarum]
MENFLLWFLAIYGTTAGCLAVAKWWYGRFRPPRVDYYLLTFNSAQHIEWVIRSTAHLSRIEGREFRFIILDSGSHDDTLAIIEKFMRKGIRIELFTDMEDPFCKIMDAHSALACCRGDQDREIKVIDLRRRHCVCEYKTS